MNARPECNGDGVIEKGTDDEQCPTCGGHGRRPYDLLSARPVGPQLAGLYTVVLLKLAIHRTLIDLHHCASGRVLLGSALDE